MSTTSRSAMKSNIRKVETSCNHCGSSERELITTGVEHEYNNTTDDVFNVVRCTQCGLVYLNPRPDVSELPTIYPPNYYAYNLEEGYDEAQKQNFYYKARYAAILQGLEACLTFVGKKDKVRVLDIGCADGHVLNWFRRVRTHHVETYGVDMNEQAVKKAEEAGHTAYAGRFEEVDLPENYFDFVWASHVIEHVPDPRQFALKVLKILRPGGIFFFWTPNINSLDAKIFRKQHWGAYHFPRHWVFYDPQSVRKLAELTGFELVHLEFQPNAIFWVWTFHSILKRNPALSKYADTLFPPINWSQTTFGNFIRNSFFAVADIWIKIFTGQTSNMGVVFRKPGKPEQ
ncbi:MAG TPA: methyltransferase domain-containing protein [Candidatus Obscuribacterales bacterium]